MPRAMRSGPRARPPAAGNVVFVKPFDLAVARLVAHVIKPLGSDKLNRAWTVLANTFD